jgi:hypothetical protein
LATYQHPASLNVVQQFRQACSILRHTTRASNPAWYQNALELNFQLHIRPDGPGISTFYFDRKLDQWSAGPALSEETLGDPAKLDSAISEILKTTRSKSATALGVVLHIADEFATTELKPELDNPAALPDLRDTAVSDPASILEDSSILATQASWRVLPYPAAGSEVIGTTITLTREYAELLETLRLRAEKENFPIITHALSAPLVAIMGLCQSIQPSAGKPFVAILQYPWFTVLAFFSDHADLRLIRTLQHRGVRRATNLRNALTTTSASLEFVEPDLFIVPLGDAVDHSLDASLRLSFTTSRVETVIIPTAEPLPAWSPEPFLCAKPATASEAAPASQTLGMLREEKWAFQDFLPSPREIVEIYPARSEMRLLRVLRLARVAVFAITVLGLAYLAFGIVELMRRDEWAFNSIEADAIKSRLAKLTAERQKVEHWDNLLADRSKAWIAMEALARMIPENGGMLVKTYSHSSKPESAPGKTKVGFVKEWKITGFARDEALDYLNTLNSRDGINAHFAEVTRITGNDSYNPEVGNRSIAVNVRTQENNSYKPTPPEAYSVADESTYPFTFDLTITQRFEATDPMAITVPKAP